ncbi:hypothetical protein FE257_004757 [Aspergillus nanangensis]|uniref:DUF8035 domain-containing protein n=1 Tax=Aspergillus nanangensis TaxID=2582783 RepID=A0AAD4GX48_ASPNN|nr:hypothetical protein FE257_004757 [Aspergillus nanangensis]
MGRRSRTRDYDEEDDYESEHESYLPPPRDSRSHRYGREPEYARRHSIPPPIEKMERLRVRDHPPPPPRFRDPFDRRFAPNPEDEVKIPHDEPMRDFKEPGGRSRSRRRYGRRPPRETVRDDDWMSGHESEDRLSFESESEGERLRRRSAELRRRHLRSQEDLAPRGGRIQRTTYERDGDRLSIPDHVKRDVRRAHSGPRYPIFSRRRPKSGYHTDYEDDSEEGSDGVRPGGGPRRNRRRFDPEHENQGDLSSAESDESGDFPPMPPMPPPQHLRVPDGYSTRRPPRAPSLEVSFEGPRSQLRGEREARKREEIIIEPRDTSAVPPPPLRVPSPDIHSRQTKESIAIPRSSAETLKHEHEILVTETATTGRDGFKEREILEEMHDKPHPPKLVPLDTDEELAMINAMPGSRHSPKEGSTSQEALPSRHLQRNPKLRKNDEQPSDDDTDLGHGKIGRRYVGVKNRRERLWTEITKDLVVKEAIERAGYEYEETVSSYYIFSYLQYDDVSALVEKSEEIRAARRRQIQEIHSRRRASMPPPRVLRDEAPPLRPASPRRRHRDRRRMKEQEIVEDPRGRRGSERW